MFFPIYLMTKQKIGGIIFWGFVTAILLSVLLIAVNEVFDATKDSTDNEDTKQTIGDIQENTNKGIRSYIAFDSLIGFLLILLAIWGAVSGFLKKNGINISA